MRNSEVLKCPVCYFEYDRDDLIPKVLPECGHTFCSKCLDQILKSKSPKCPLDRKPIDAKDNAHAFSTNMIVMQVLDEHSSGEHGICSLHQELKSLFCMTDKTKICPSCVDGNDDALHHGHEVKALSEIDSQVREKSAQLKANMIKLDGNQKELIDMLEEKKNEAFGLKKRKFDAIRSFVDAKENEVWSELGLLFAQKKTKTEEQFKKDQTLKQQIQIHFTALNENKLNKAFFDALNKSEIKRKIVAEREEQELDRITKKIEGELNLSEAKISKSLVTAFEQFGPHLDRVMALEQDLPSGKGDGLDAMLLKVSSLIQMRRKGELIELYHPGLGRTNDDIQGDIVQLKELKGVKNVKLNLKSKKIAEETLFALGYLWKELKDVNDLSIEVSLKHNDIKDLILLFNNSFWISEKTESFTFAFKYNLSDNIIWSDPQSSLFFSRFGQMTNLKALCLNFSNCHFTDQALLSFANKVIPVLKSLEVLDLDFSRSDITIAGISELFLKAKGILQKVKSFSLDISFTQVSINFIDALTKDVLPIFAPLEKFSFAMDSPIDFDEDKFDDFWINLATFMTNVKSFSFSMSFVKLLKDPHLAGFARHVLPIMTLLEHLKLSFLEVEGITSITFDNLAKYSPTLSSLKSLTLKLGSNHITDFGLKVLAQDLLPAMKKLENFEFDGCDNDFGDRGVCELWKSLSPIAQNLKSFRFSFIANDVTEACFEDFSDNLFSNMCNIRSLNIEIGPEYSGESVEKFLAIFDNIADQIEDLVIDLSHNEEISDSNLSNFIQNILPMMTSLRKLTLVFSDTEITSAIVEPICDGLRKLRNLEFVNIEYAIEMENVMLEELKKNNPNFEIISGEISYE